MKTTISIPEASVSAARDALQDDAGRLRGWTRGWLDDSPIYTKDSESDTEIDPDGNFTGTVDGRILRLNFRHPHIPRIVQEVLDAAAITYEVLESVQGDVLTDEDGVDAHLAESSRRRPGRKYAAYGTFAANGAKPSQTVGLPGKIINQWNKTIKFRNLDKDGSTGTVTIKSAGDYLIEARISWDVSLAPVVVWTFQSAVNNAGTGNTKTSDDGDVRGILLLPGLSVGDMVGIGAIPDAPAQEFKVLDAKARISRQ